MKEQTINQFFLLNTREELEKIDKFFQVVIHFHPSHSPKKITNTRLWYARRVIVNNTELLF